MAAVDINALSDEALVHHELQLERGLGKDSLRNTFRSSFKPDTSSGDVAPVGQAAGGFLSGIADKFGLGGDDAENAES